MSAIMYFIGVTTGQSSMMKIFPRWMDILGVEARLVGIDLPPGAPAADYRAVVARIKDEPETRGALVTTHKIGVYAAARDLFDAFDPYAQICEEVSAIYKREGRLIGGAVDPISSGLAWRAFIPDDHWARNEAEVLCFGGGGAAIAISTYAASLPPASRPRRFTLTDIAPDRLDHARTIHARLHTDLPFEYVLNGDPAVNDARMAALPPGSLVINATGMGKDRPGSPITDAGVFPQGGFAWEINYRGALDFLHQAERQRAERALTVEDGWIYFVHGWAQVVARVFDSELTPEIFARLDQAARDNR
jgi:shikimate 5-dehydrogenase